jgi:hypothetical protein
VDRYIAELLIPRYSVQVPWFEIVIFYLACVVLGNVGCVARMASGYDV